MIRVGFRLAIKDKNKRLENIFNDIQNFEAVIRTSGRKGYFQPENDIKSNTWFFVEPSLMTNYTGLNLDDKFYLEAI